MLNPDDNITEFFKGLSPPSILFITYLRGSLYKVLDALSAAISVPILSSSTSLCMLIFLEYIFWLYTDLLRLDRDGLRGRSSFMLR